VKAEKVLAVVRFDRFYTLLNQALTPPFSKSRSSAPSLLRRTKETPQYKMPTALKTDVFKAVVRFEKHFFK
jgi:hypothetical protein